MEFGAGMAGNAAVCVYDSRVDRDDVITVDAEPSDTEVERHSCRHHKKVHVCEQSPSHDRMGLHPHKGTTPITQKISNTQSQSQFRSVDVMQIPCTWVNF